ncbi:Gametocyte-specific factor 1 [Anthophora quadrimaculata]
MNPILTCPYDVTHRIRKTVMPYHLMRCRANHSSGKVQCPFDAFHVVDEDYLKQHILNCASSGNVRREQYSFEPNIQLGSVSLETVKNLSVPVMQDWKEENIGTYDPWRNTETKNIIRSLTGLTKSQKKLFKLAERRRMCNLKSIGVSVSNQQPHFKHQASNYCINIAYLAKNFKKLSLDDIDVLLQSIDISKLVISDVN